MSLQPALPSDTPTDAAISFHNGLQPAFQLTAALPVAERMIAEAIGLADQPGDVSRRLASATAVSGQAAAAPTSALSDQQLIDHLSIELARTTAAFGASFTSTLLIEMLTEETNDGQA